MSNDLDGLRSRLASGDPALALRAHKELLELLSECVIEAQDSKRSGCLHRYMEDARRCGRLPEETRDDCMIEAIIKFRICLKGQDSGDEGF